jgi:Na+-driven multidrug efflux pump
VTTTLFNYLILGLAGNVGVAAYGVIANFALIFTCIFNGISQGAQPLVSRYYGEGNERAVKKILHLGLATGVVFSLLIISLVWGFTDPMVALFNGEHSVKMAEYAFTGMRLYVIGFLFAGFNIIGTGYLSASEHAKEAFTASVCRGFVAIAVCSVILSRMFGIRGVWLSFMAAEALTAGITAWALLKDHKKEAMA